MKFQTVINHEVEWGKVNLSPSFDVFSMSIEFKIKHSDKVKNNTITLQNLIRTCPEMKQYIKDTVMHYANFNEIQPTANGERMGTRGGFSIYPRSSGKGNIYIALYHSQAMLDDPEAAIDELLGGC